MTGERRHLSECFETDRKWKTGFAPARQNVAMDDERTGDIEAARTLVSSAQRITVLTGAGISTDSGIPDFRGPNGVWTKNPAAEKSATLQNYLADPEVRGSAWQNRLRSPGVARAEPNAGHLALVELERQGKLVARRHPERRRAAPAAPAAIPAKVSRSTARCTGRCAGRAATGGRWIEPLDRVRAGEDDPACVVCRAEGDPASSRATRSASARTSCRR